MRNTRPARLFAMATLRTTLGWLSVLVLVSCSSSVAPTATSTWSTGATTTPPVVSPTDAATTTSMAATTTTTEPLTLTGAVVRVANSSGRPGAATRLSDALIQLGFTVAPATNGFGPEARLDVTRVYALVGSEAVARSISRVLGGVKVLPMPTPAWIDGGTAALGTTTVLVMLGRDLGGRELPPTAAVSG